MKKYLRLVQKYWGYADQDIPLCWHCFNDFAVDWHHIEPRRSGGSKMKDRIDNLIPLCRPCHTKAAQHKISKDKLKKNLMEKINAKTHNKNIIW